METAPYTAALAAEVRASMGRAGLRQADLAKTAGLSRPSLSRKLAGRQTFTAEELLRVADVLGVKASDLMAQAEAVLAA